MTQPGQHIADEHLSDLIDQRLSADDESAVRAHVGTCAACQARLDELRVVVGLLHQLPLLPVPRDFQLTTDRGLVAMPDPPNVVRLRRWYTASRVVSAALAALFVALSASTLYIDSRPVPRASTLSGQAQVGSAPADAARGAAAPANPPSRVLSAASPAPPASAPAPASAAAARSQAAPPSQPGAGEAADQVVAATSVRPLPTQVPTPVPVAATPRAAVPQASDAADSAAPLRVTAISVGVLAVLGLLIVLIVRDRLARAVPHPGTE